MANTTRRDVELRINANDLSEKTLQQLLDTFEKLRASQEAFGKSGDLTQRSVRELKQELADLQAVAVELKSRAALVDQFLAIEKQAGDAATRVEVAKAALQKFNAAQAEGTELTKKEQTEFNRLSREVGKAETHLTSTTAKLHGFNAELAKIGAGDATATGDALRKFGSDIGASMEAAEQSIRKYDEALRASALREEAATKAKRQAAVAAAELKTAQDALTTGVGFNAQGRDALKAASTVEVLTRDYDQLASSSRKAGDGIRETLDPTRQAVASLNGLEGEVKRLHAQLDSMHTGPKLGEELKQLRAEYNAFAADAGRAAASLVDDIGSYRKVDASLAALRTRIEGAQQSVQGFAAQMAVAAVPSETLARDLASSQAKLKGFIGEFDREAQALANLGMRLREAGVDVKNLTDAEARLAGVAGGVVESQRKIEAVAVRVTQLAQATQDLKAAEEALKGGVAFNQLGRDALKAAGGVEVLSRDYDALAVTSRKAGDGIRGIIDPSRQALASLDGLEAQTQKLNDQLQQAQSSTKLREEVRKLRSEYASLATDTGKAAAALVDDIGSYRQAEQAVGSLRVRVEQAQQSVLKFAGEMAVAAEPSDALVRSLAAAKSQLNTLVNDFDRQSTALAKLRAALKEAGVNTGLLSEAEGRLARVAHGVVTAQEALGVAAVKVGKGSGEAAKGVGLFEDSGRKALSTAQRLRGELLSLASSYLGLFAAVNVAKGAIDAAVSREGIMRRLELTEGGVEQAKAKWEQLRATADRLGISFEKSAVGFSNISIGAKESGLTAEETDRFFEHLAGTVRGLSLDADNTARVFTAVTQVFGKGKLQSEELTQQMGEHLPAVLALAAKALNQNADALRKNLEAGNLGVRALVVIFDEYFKLVGRLSKNTNSTVDALAKFTNAIYDFKLALADSGFLKTFTDLLNDATRRLNAGEFKSAIEGLGNLFKLAAGAAKLMLEYSTATAAVIVTLISYNVGKVIFGIASAIKNLAFSTGLMTGAVNLLSVAFTFLAANPVVRLITIIGLAIAAIVSWIFFTEKGRGSMRALWQIVLELGGALNELLHADFTALGKRWETFAGRVSGAFHKAKKDVDDFNDAAGQGHGAQGSWGPPAPKRVGATGTWTDKATEDAKDANDARLAEAEQTHNKLVAFEKDLQDVRTAADKEEAKLTANTEAEVRAEHQKTQDHVDAMFKRYNETHDEAVLLAAEDMQNALNIDIARIVAAKKAEAAKLAGKTDLKSRVGDEIELSRQRAEATKDGIQIEQAILEQGFKEGQVSLRDYYAKRLDETNRGLDAEIKAARENKVSLEKLRGIDPTVPKKIDKLDTEIAGKINDKKLAERSFRLEAELAEQAIRRQLDAVQTELDVMTGDDRQAGLRAIQRSYEDQLKQANLLTGAERDRALATLDTVTTMKGELLDMQLMVKVTDHLIEMEQARHDNAVSNGDRSHLQDLAEQSRINQKKLDQLQAEAAQYVLLGQEGSDAYAAIQVQIEKAKGQTDLLAKEISADLKTAATSFVETLIQTKSPEKAMKAFGKSLGTALSKAFVDEASQDIVDGLKGIFKLLKSSGAFDAMKGLFTSLAGWFTPTATGHTGAVIGYGGASKPVSPLAFIGAARYHSGGLPGLRRDEVAFIGLKGEEVLSKNDPRNVMNAGKNPAGSAGGPLVVQLHPDAMHMTLRDWLQGELARVSATQ